VANIGTSVDWWMSTKSPATLFRPSYQTDELEDFLRENAGVEPALLAADTGVGRNHIRACQRRLGLRKITGNKPRKPKA
jgi:hypothetical protein